MISSGAVGGARAPVLFNPEISTIASCAWITLTDGSRAAPSLLRGFLELSRDLPRTIAWIVLRVPHPSLLTVDTATGIAVAHRALATHGQRLVLHTPALPVTSGAISALRSVPTILDGGEHVDRLTRLRHAAEDLHLLRHG